MESFLRKPKDVAFGDLYLDPNNPRFAPEDPPGYEDADALFDKDLQNEVEGHLRQVYKPETLVQSISSQGWMPIDNIVVWPFPGIKDHYVVVEGNTRTLALREIRSAVLPKERKKLERMKSNSADYASHDVSEQQRIVDKLEQAVADTEEIQVVPIAADSAEELNEKLPRILAVRHITGAKGWGSYYQDLWLLERYRQHFALRHGENADLYWEPDLVRRVADEASLSLTVAKRKMKATSAFSHFRREFEGDLPKDEEFRDTDYYLFENIVRKPWLRDQFGFGEDALHLSEEGEQALFDWVFKLPRGRKAEDNPNVFYRHENVLVWEKMRRYDESQKKDAGVTTTFAARFDVSDPTNAPRMEEVEAEYLSHKARRQPQEIVGDLIKRLREMPMDAIANSGEILKDQLAQLEKLSGKYLRMIHAAEA